MDGSSGSSLAVCRILYIYLSYQVLGWNGANDLFAWSVLFFGGNYILQSISEWVSAKISKECVSESCVYKVK